MGLIENHMYRFLILKFSILIILFLLGIVHLSKSQEQVVEERFDQYRKANYQEKIYITLDRELYLAGEILWFKVYCVNASTHQFSDLSKVAYVELIGEDSALHMQSLIKLENGIGNGSYQLPTNLTSGRFQLRAYTRWMRNYAPAFYFQKEINIINSFRKMPIFETDKSDTIDIRFFPEGGDLIRGIESKVAFKGVDNYGTAINFMGCLLDFNNDTIVKFMPTHLGMGTFKFTPVESKSYKVIINCDGKSQEVNLPEIKRDGIYLSVKEEGSDIVINVLSTKPNEDIHLLAHTRNIISYSKQHTINEGKLSVRLNKNKLPRGINHLTLFNERNIPLSERLFFVMPDDLMNVEISSSQNTYKKRENIKLEIKSSGDDPNLSVSVYKLDSLNEIGKHNIISYLYLSSDLKGKIENPAFYFSDEMKNNEIDLLMLTHGWRRFKWDDIMGKNSYLSKKYIPEIHDHLITGKVLNINQNAPASHVDCYLSSPGRLPHFYSSKSDQNGNILFETNDLWGQRELIAQTNFAIDSIFAIRIEDPFDTNLNLDFCRRGLAQKYSQEVINARSVGLQVLNIYHKKQINKYGFPEVDTTLFYGEADQTYYLDDYTRFTVMEDVMREYIYGVRVRKNDEEFRFRILNSDKRILYEKDPLILYDGVPVFSANEIMKIDPLNIKRLDVVVDRYYYRTQTYDGIVGYTSYEGNLPGYQIDPRSLLITYHGLKISRQFYSPDYKNLNNPRIPDFRNLLYWSSEVVPRGGKANIEFFSSDIPGKYLTVVEGLSKDGKPGYSTFIFEVNASEIN